MKLKLLAAVFIMTLTASKGMAIPYSFTNITNNNAGDAAIGEAQMMVDVTGVGTSEVLFHFTNSGPDASSIVQIYFDEPTNPLFTGISFIDDTLAGVEFSEGASPSNLPGPSPFAFNSDYESDADNQGGKQANGINQGEWLGLRLMLSGGSTYANVINSLNDGTFRIGIHVQGYDSGGSESFISTGTTPPPPTPTPEPATMVLFGTGLLGAAALRRRRK